MTKKIPLTKGKTALVDDEDYAELSKYSWHAIRNRHTWYARRGEWRDGNQHIIRMHRQILDAPPNKDVDHINRNGLDNRKENLRFCTNAQNQANKRPQTGASSKFKGVSLRKQTGKWQAYIKKNGDQHYLGVFDDEEGAARAYNEAAEKMFGEFARLNEIES